MWKLHVWIKEVNKMKVKNILFWLLLFILYVMSIIIGSVTDWFNIRFGVSFEEILFTIISPLEGADVDFLDEAVQYVLLDLKNAIPYMLLGIFITALIVSIFKKIHFLIKVNVCRLSIGISGYGLYRMGCLCLVILLLVNSISYGFDSLDLGDYISRRMQKTTIYEDYYVAPSKENISLDDEPKNLIYIYLESMETTYAAEEDGGAQAEINYIPNLTKLAKENVSFSGTEKLGGALVSTGTGWTMGALFGSTSGVPFAFPINGNAMQQYESFASGIISLGDILESYGYNQIFLCGSDGTFAGRKKYFEQHGNYEVRDLFYAKEKGYIPEDYYVWWGYEDLKLYDIAKQELVGLAENDELFNFTMLTVDTHHVDGYVCENCSDTYEHQLGNVLECADNQVYEFIQWCQEQDFYEDTVIVITGDHFRMDSSLVADKERRLYNCIVNSDTKIQNSTQNRIFTSLDLFPTTLSALGFSIKGNRLGLGTDLFSSTPTLSEEMGYSVFDAELGKYSDYYVEVFE